MSVIKNSPLQAIILLGTLKHAGTVSHTEALCEVLIEALDKYAVKTDILRLVDYNIRPGVTSDEGKGDDWPKILKQILAADIIIFATPIWWGVQSSVLQRAIERMDGLNEELLNTGRHPLAGKVGGVVMTGAEDGVQHVIGNLANMMIWNGLTVPPASTLSYLGNYPEETKEALVNQFRKQKTTAGMARTMARNLTFFARLLKEYPIPRSADDALQNVAPDRE